MKMPAHLRTDREQRDYAIAYAEQMEYERDELLALSNAMHDLDLFDAFAYRYGTTPQETRLVMALYRANGRRIPKGELNDQIGDGCQDRSGIETNIVNVLVCRIRNKCGGDSIANLWGHGFSCGLSLKKKIDDLKAELTIEAAQ